ncbi:hypothetical protein [Sphingobacterium griseoflavum]|uniref:Uncharacterized protein n=1 Tax=Sphingobacterium griseoflavum TaxID=1474952 RepID=A0ABQ3HUV6_9SPHI|nr:hypothetical protein [Sphingobacterium griseoflavum]GHE36980.1 hypothetical protein GCM10017764_20240 [Sphingobacterium griseoflavum]
MIAFKLTFKNDSFVLPISQQENTTIHVYDNGGVGLLYATSLNEDSLKQDVWLDSTVDIGDVLELEIMETNEVSKPLETVTVEKIIKKSKREVFLELEQDLKQRGLL